MHFISVQKTTNAINIITSPTTLCRWKARFQKESTTMTLKNFLPTNNIIIVALFLLLLAPQLHAEVILKSKNTQSGFIARLLINEAPFPGERGWVSEDDSKAAMLAILWVCHGRIHHIPSGYRQSQIAAVRTTDIIDVITVGGEKGQCDGFYRDSNGNACAVPRVHKRIDYLLKISNDGKPGKFARLLNFAQGLADNYVNDGMLAADRFATVNMVQRVPVTGRAYSWMTDKDCYSPGGNFIKIPNNQSGSLGGNRFFTLRKK